MPSPEEAVVLCLAEVRPCAEDPDLVHLVGDLSPPAPRLVDDVLDPAVSVRLEVSRTWIIRRRPSPVRILLGDDGRVIVTRAPSEAAALDALRTILQGTLRVQDLAS